MYWDKIKKEKIIELNGWESLQSWKNSLDRSGTLSDRQIYIDGLLDDEIETVSQEFIAQKSSVPQIVTPRQARLALSKQGVRTIVENAIIDSNDQDLKDEWEYSTEIRRDWESLITLTQSLGMTEDQIDDLFILAGSL